MLNDSGLIKIAIVGGGPAGVSLCLQLSQALNELNLETKIHILLFEKSSDIGWGTPYSLREEAFCINLPKEYMTLIPEKYHHFSQWLTARYKEQLTTFPARHYFGQYAQEQFATLQNSNALEIIPCIEHDVLDIFPIDSAHYQIHARHKNQEVTYQVTQVILAIGHLPSNLFAHLHLIPHYQINPWDMQAYQNLPTHYHVGIIGSRLTAIDVALKLRQQKHQGPITMISRLGLLSSVRGSHPIPMMRYLTPINIQNLLLHRHSQPLLPSLISLFEQEITPYLPEALDLSKTINLIQSLSPLERIRYEIHHAVRHKTAWQSVLSCFYQITFRLWPQFPVEQQQLFLQNDARLMSTFLCSFPLNKAQIIYAMMRRQQLSVHKGLTDIVKTPTHFSVALEQEKPILCDHIILAVGSGNNPETVPLLVNLLKQKLIKKHPLGGICIDTKTHQVLAPNAAGSSRIFALGELVKGSHFKMIEIGQVVEQARIITHQVIKQVMETTTVC
ncbi:FAD/NAD(P)-binding protein [Legionella fallonii]|uniref:FAD-dependent urate hydroxylase HpyO/Asp monooxygenase CreE-like FAD/NAD(P)-binding domain-containing protein n=1 Tax=Legionella fallonii LLAP-10 TaxID=1212491 RepID=A0A098FZU7_9GAMM|nr:FAD/NAD(P)-binding protein [Legionella fallonii]CEG55757.1 protein of unknown function [FAD/NAD(P)-binding domain] [Legionella fallonii LLAP-10]